MKNVNLWTLAHGPAPFMRLAELEIDPAWLEEFKTASAASIEASVRLEAGVLALYAVSMKNDPNRILVFEMYRDEAAYNAHRETAHFKRFFETTLKMVKSRKLLDAQPIVLGAKADWAMVT